MLQIFHTDILSILTGVPEVQRYVVDRRTTDITAVITNRLFQKRWNSLVTWKIIATFEQPELNQLPHNMFLLVQSAQLLWFKLNIISLVKQVKIFF